MAISKNDRERLMKLFGTSAGRRKFLANPGSSGVNLSDANTKKLVNMLKTMSDAQLAAIAKVNKKLYDLGQAEGTGPMLARAV